MQHFWIAFFVKKFFEDANVSPFGFFRAVGKNSTADIRNGNDTPVGVHFGQPGHELRVSGLELTSKNATSRKVRERSWIDFFKQTEVFSCMNRDDGIDFLTL